MLVMELKIIEAAKNVIKEIRKEEVMAIKTRFPNKVPVIVQRFHKERYLPQLEKTKFLVPQDITMSQFQTIIRNRIRISNPNQAMYLLINERSMLSMSLTVGEAYSEFSGPSGFLHITYASQEVFGSDLRN
ncbi:microtubule-associated proteins 1A/1B light chain 3C-like isoform X2 [Cylas formicarius]|uniref:microtubule-associated proteins 1A/1B light chain 3C-like isoform X2 n=1 Tax=Cylas formicarius TaxID=197179 RepID=UPI0029587870|nr:microtubule-associated proteins 1A/1B light chain 3C-like isoform X2 [Cylas formicarius]